jgi:hypothetical protein
MYVTSKLLWTKNVIPKRHFATYILLRTVQHVMHVEGRRKWCVGVFPKSFPAVCNTRRESAIVQVPWVWSLLGRVVSVWLLRICLYKKLFFTIFSFFRETNIQALMIEQTVLWDSITLQNVKEIHVDCDPIGTSHVSSVCSHLRRFYGVVITGQECACELLPALVCIFLQKVAFVFTKRFNLF